VPSQLLVRGRGFDAEPVTAVTIGGVAVSAFVVLSDSELQVVSGALSVGAGLDLVVVRGAASATLAGALEAWSPAELPGARVFDAAIGVASEGSEGAATHYEWQRLSASLAPEWRARRPTSSSRSTCASSLRIPRGREAYHVAPVTVTLVGHGSSSSWASRIFRTIANGTIAA